MDKFVKVQRLFWDADVKKSDLKKYGNFVITRVAEKGGVDDIKWLLGIYGKSRIKKIVNSSRNVSVKTKNFWQVI